MHPKLVCKVCVTCVYAEMLSDLSLFQTTSSRSKSETTRQVPDIFTFQLFLSWCVACSSPFTFPGYHMYPDRTTFRVYVTWGPLWKTWKCLKPNPIKVRICFDAVEIHVEPVDASQAKGRNFRVVGFPKMCCSASLLQREMFKWLKNCYCADFCHKMNVKSQPDKQIKNKW